MSMFEIEELTRVTEEIRDLIVRIIWLASEDCDVDIALDDLKSAHNLLIRRLNDLHN